jgi:acyl-CoA thioesterase-1
VRDGARPQRDVDWRDATAAFPAALQQRIDAEGFDYAVVNAGVSRDTSAQAVARLDRALDGDVRILILAVGANDGLRGVPVAEVRRNISRIIEAAQARRIKVLLLTTFTWSLPSGTTCGWYRS